MCERSGDGSEVDRGRRKREQRQLGGILLHGEFPVFSAGELLPFPVGVGPRKVSPSLYRVETHLPVASSMGQVCCKLVK